MAIMSGVDFSSDRYCCKFGSFFATPRIAMQKK